jgi:hypothetical protein
MIFGSYLVGNVRVAKWWFHIRRQRPPKRVQLANPASKMVPQILIKDCILFQGPDWAFETDLPGWALGKAANLQCSVILFLAGRGKIKKAAVRLIY